MRYRNRPTGAASVVVIGIDPDGMGFIRECLGTEAVLPTQATPYDDAVQVVRKTQPNVVLVSFDNDFEAAIALGPRLNSDNNSLHLVAISERTDPERIRSAMRAGYREYVVLPEDEHLLRKAVHNAAFNTQHNDDSGELIAVISSKGGMGSTTLAVNLAAELSAVHRLCVVDLDFSMGDVSAFLDLQPVGSIRDLLQNLHRMDARMLSGSVAHHPASKIHILAQPLELTDPEEFSPEDILRVLSIATEAYQYVIADCGSQLNAATVTTTAAADLILLVCTPDVVSIKNAWRRLQLMERQDIELESVRLVVNRWEKNAELTDIDIETNLGIPIAARIAADPEVCGQAVALGQLLRDVERHSVAADHIASMIGLVTERADVVEPPPSRGLLGWLRRSSG